MGGTPFSQAQPAAQGNRLGGGRLLRARAPLLGCARRCSCALCWRHPALQLHRGVGGREWAVGLPEDLCVAALALGLGRGAHGADPAGLTVLSGAVAEGPVGRGLGLPLLTPVCHRPRPRGPRGGARGPGGPGSPTAGEAAQPPLPLRPAGQWRYGHPQAAPQPLSLSLRLVPCPLAHDGGSTEPALPPRGRPQPVQLVVRGQPLGRQCQRPAHRVAGAVLVLGQHIAGGAGTGGGPGPRRGRAGRLAAAQASAAAAAAGGGPPGLLGQRHRHRQPLLLLWQLLVLRRQQPGRVACRRRVWLAAQPAAGSWGARAQPLCLPPGDSRVPGAQCPAAPLRHAPQPAPGTQGPDAGRAGRP